MTLWFKRSCQLSQDPAMQSVVLEHTAIAIPVFEELMALCKIGRGAGRVTVAYGQLGHRLMMKPAKIKAIVAALDHHELIVIDFEESDARALVADIPAWAKWNPKDPTGADRKRAQRDRQTRNVTGQAVTVTDVTSEIRHGKDRPQSKRESKEKRLGGFRATQPRADGSSLNGSGEEAA